MLYNKDTKFNVMTPQVFRSKVREGEWRETTVATCPGYAQASLATVPIDWAAEFLLFCQRNSEACPVVFMRDSVYNR